ncbi:MAG: RNA polymerase sigma factor [Salinibacter sp.]
MPPAVSAEVRPRSPVGGASSRPDDEELRALRNRDPSAVEKWICGCREALHAHVLRYTHDAEQAREVVQETIVRALEGLPSFRGESKVSTWLYSIARNVALQRVQNDDRCVPSPPDQLRRLRCQNAPDRGGGVPESETDARVEREERLELFYEAMSALSPSYREIIRLRDLEEKTTAETAEATGLTEVNVRVRLHRARTKVREALNQMVDAPAREGPIPQKAP